MLIVSLYLCMGTPTLVRRVDTCLLYVQSNWSPAFVLFFFPVFTVLKKRDNAHYPKMTYSIRRLDYRWHNITFRVYRRGCWGILVCLARFMYTIMLSEPTLSIWVFGYFISNIYSLLEYLSRKQYWRTQCDSG